MGVPNVSRGQTRLGRHRFGKLCEFRPDLREFGQGMARVLLESAGIPLVGGIKRLPVTFTPRPPVGE